MQVCIEPVRRIWGDEYTGTAEQLVAAGIVRDDELPGRPGNGITMMTFGADGARIKKGNSSSASGMAGYRQIRKCSRRLFTVCRSVGSEEADRRREAYFEERRAQEELRRAWPFPICVGVPC